jgi:NAD(P)H-hydrate repair Nnr-like enzyme with NAD(P)H-hydrate dehydratase domain
LSEAFPNSGMVAFDTGDSACAGMTCVGRAGRILANTANS